MVSKILMPALSPTMTEGKFIKWTKNEGDYVEPGDVIAEIETDKAIMEVEAMEHGVLGKLLVADGDDRVQVGNIIALLLKKGEDASVLREFMENDMQQDIQQDNNRFIAKSPMLHESFNISTCCNSERIFASPLAKKIANDHGVDLHLINGSGPHGRIVKHDVICFIDASKKSYDKTMPTFTQKTQAKEISAHIGSTKNEEIIQKTSVQMMMSTTPTHMISTSSSISMINSIPLSSKRKIIADRLSESKRTIPHFYLNIVCNADKLVVLRNNINSALQSQSSYKISVNDMIVKIVAMAMRDVPEINVTWENGGVILHNSVDIAIAIALNDGLVAPVLRNVSNMSLANVSNESKILIEKARNNAIKLDEFHGGSVTISNLGMFGIDSFQAIINPPHGCIVAVGALLDSVIAKDGAPCVAKTISITLSCDHRMIDGAIGAKFLGCIRRYIEEPLLILV